MKYTKHSRVKTPCLARKLLAQLALSAYGYRFLFRWMGYRRNVVILIRETACRKGPELRFLPGLVYRKYPAFTHALQNRRTVYNRTVERIVELEREGSVFVIRPEEALNVGRMDKDPAHIQRAYDAGYAGAKKWLGLLLRLTLEHICGKQVVEA